MRKSNLRQKIKSSATLLAEAVFFAGFVYVASVIPNFLKQYTFDVQIVPTVNADTPTSSYDGGYGTGYGWGNHNGAGDSADGACDGNADGPDSCDAY
ncbi:hypothetical protein COU14_00110 [Candidatus Kaiserbacteria bacterium CG10_big_fil_rev_8_21_14_0_10_44_10]|uniref:Uncharacterized protein n=1 Tax=Candidatus Kaiserbacteria bacterium CG10_big_fil_rev_8_21_14_0_10_44_10 TaxID=1974606 RepID=A0A2H0UII9_9BACT|nr:MAG: hypothetical protein COU14_00110 [Candidatus Kaiserbacteria bacterium CG10_big_fil_rev_8_21_14_0_10_44_10]